jgi:hypothetical protein
MDEAQRPSRRGLLIALALTALIALPVLTETLLRGLGVGRSTQYWVEYGTPRNWVANRSFAWEDLPARVSPDLVREFVPMPKPKDEFRVIVCGDTQAHGWPSPLFSWPRLAGVMLGDAVTNLRVRVVNASVPFADVATIALVLDQSLRLQPDAVVFAPGVGEYFSTHGPGNPLARQEISFDAIQARRQSRDYRLVQWWKGPSFTLPEYRDLVDVSSLWASFRRDQAVTDAQRQPSRERVRNAVEHVQRACEGAGVPLIIALPPASLPDHPPFLSTASDGKPLAAHAELSSRLESARADYREGRWDAGLASLEPLLAAHPGLAEAHHLAGRLHRGPSGIWRLDPRLSPPGTPTGFPCGGTRPCSM